MATLFASTWTSTIPWTARLALSSASVSTTVSHKATTHRSARPASAWTTVFALLIPMLSTAVCATRASLVTVARPTSTSAPYSETPTAQVRHWLENVLKLVFSYILAVKIVIIIRRYLRRSSQRLLLRMPEWSNRCQLPIDNSQSVHSDQPPERRALLRVAKLGVRRVRALHGRAQVCRQQVRRGPLLAQWRADMLGRARSNQNSRRLHEIVPQWWRVPGGPHYRCPDLRVPSRLHGWELWARDWQLRRAAVSEQWSVRVTSGRLQLHLSG